MRRVLDAPEAERPGLVRELWAPMEGAFRYVPGGMDLLEVHRMGFGFPWNGDDAAIRSGLAALEAADAWTRLGRALDAGARAISAAAPSAEIADVAALLVLGDPGNGHFMDEVESLVASGGISGYISMTVWPTPTILRRLEAIAVHELHHNVRYSPGGVVWDPATVPLGEQVVAEGLADVFASELYGDAGPTHFVAPETHADDAVLAKVMGALDTTGMQNFAAWILGDASARLFGAPPAGVPTGAGYAVGARVVRAFLAEAGGTAASHVHTPAADIIAVARREL